MKHMKYPEYKGLDLATISQTILAEWESNNIFAKSISTRNDSPAWIFYEGPPSANGMPGIHHVMARTIKDIFCRYKTLKGFRVERKGGWDTHGLPVELQVEKTLGITKEDIGKSITIEEYNKACRNDVMKFKDKWDDITKQMGYWVDLDNPYITFDNKYIETVWYLIKQLSDKGFLYKGYTIQPYSPAAGTGLSTHELNLPGCYRMVKDNTVVAQFKICRDQKSDKIFDSGIDEAHFLAWTTTPWTLPSNTALAVGKDINYILAQTYNPYTYKLINVILAEDLFEKYFPEKNKELSFSEYKEGDKAIPYKRLAAFKGKELEGIRYEQLLPFVQPEEGDPFRVVIGDFVTTEDGTGIVHIAPSFGADDFRMNRLYNVGALTLVDSQGRFDTRMGEFAGKYVKKEYNNNATVEEDSVDVEIIVKLKKENKAFKTEKYEHSYPHCWRTDKPILYYPLDSWFIKTTAFKDRMAQLNKTINWKPESTGTGRFGNWLENLVDWNLSRSRYWGIPLPVWQTEDGSEHLCIGSVEELMSEIQKSVDAGVMEKNIFEGFVSGDMSKENYTKIDLHKPYVDAIVLVSKTGKKMYRESDLIDVWFDSGAMPYAQLHYPFENADVFKQRFPADFIAEGVDQTRGWFFTLHALATMLFDSVAFKNVVSNGLVLDKDGNKMSKRLGNGVNPFEVIDKYGPDATRWYMITNSQPWDNLKFDVDGIGEIQRKFFGTLYNTYSFFVLYANIDGFAYKETEIPVQERPELDRWILSELNTLIAQVDNFYEDFEPTKAGRAIQQFLDEHLSNWYVRLCRRRFWKGEYSLDKIAAYQTLYTCLVTIAKLSSPIAPFYMDRLFKDLNVVSGKDTSESIHLSDFPKVDDAVIDKQLEERMELAQKISSMVLSLRKRLNIRVRQPLNKIMIPTSDTKLMSQIDIVKSIILSEVNIKDIEFVNDKSNVWKKKIKPDFKKLGPKFGKQMKEIAALIQAFDQTTIQSIEQSGEYVFDQIEGKPVLTRSDVEIITEDIPGWVISNIDTLTVALDITITDNLKEEGIAREIINRIQNLRKDMDFEVTDKISVKILKKVEIILAIRNYLDYICTETLTTSFEVVDDLDHSSAKEIEIIDDIKTLIDIRRTN